MSLTREDIENLLKEPEDAMEREMKAKNPAAIAQLYHPDAVVVHKGVKASYGREEIQKVYELFVQMTGEFVVRPDYAGASEDGEYLIRRGVWTVSDNPKEFEYEQVYKKVNGKYLIYHDEFSYEE